jgi:hypothetical protein
MENKMIRMALIFVITAFLLTFTAVAVFAASVACAAHYNSPCYSTGEHRYINGQDFEKYSCNCGDVYWVPK